MRAAGIEPGAAGTAAGAAARTAGAPLLSVDRVSFAHGRRPILQDISFEAHAGQMLAIVGANGAGKSTLLDVLSGVRRAASGTVRLAGGEQTGYHPAELARLVSHLPQTVAADLPFTAGQMVAMGRYPHTDRWFESEEDHRQIEAAMRRTGCVAFRERAVASLSGGERQRVLLAACLAQDASVLLLDEPSTFLDVEAQLDCFALLRAEAAAGRLAIAVTHDLNLALTYATRILVMESGRLVQQLDTAQAAAQVDWLARFSPRLRMGATPHGAPLVWYE